MSEILQRIDEFGQAVLEMRKAHDKQHAELLERVEIIETNRERPKKAGARGAEFSEFETSAGKMYALPSSTKMADVPALRPEKEPEVSMYRWLAAAVAGEKCGDKMALEYAREFKQMTTGTTGIVIPAQYISQWIDLLRAQSVLQRAGVQTLVMDAKSAVMGAVTVDPAATWHSEGGSISADNPPRAS